MPQSAIMNRPSLVTTIPNGEIDLWRDGYEWLVSYTQDGGYGESSLYRAGLRNVTFIGNPDSKNAPWIDHTGVIHGTLDFIGDQKNAFRPEITFKNVIRYDEARRIYTYANNPLRPILEADYVLVESKKGDLDGVIIAGFAS